MVSDSTPTPARLHELFEYRDGQLIRRSTGRVVGCPAGVGGRLQASADGRMLYVHRIVWAMHHGDVPQQIDHIDGDKLNNRIENLRPATNSQNTQNVRRKGVTFEHRKVERPWRARIMVDGRSISLGYFDTEEQAMAAYLEAKRKMHPFWVTGLGRAS